jgi:hypothetical protein
MPDLAEPPRYYFQTSQTDSIYGGTMMGWRTIIVTFDPVSAEKYAWAFEHAQLSELGDDVSELVSTVARIMTVEELVAEGGEEALVAAEHATAAQYELRLSEWQAAQL